MSADRYKCLLWTDLETTGSSLEQGDEIMEVGIVATDLDFNIISTFSVTVRPSDNGFRRLEANEFVCKMHADNGLTDECRELSQTFHNVTEADKAVMGWLADTTAFEAGEYLIAGSGVSHFDRWFIRRYMPQFESVLHYASLDIGTLRRGLRMLAGEAWVPHMPESQTGEGKAHRALSDASAHLEEARAYKKLFSDVMEDLGILKDLRESLGTGPEPF